jgi:hypothetical protein
MTMSNDNTTLATRLERLVSSYNITSVIQALADLCESRAQHVADCWDDPEYARLWTNLARELTLAVVASRSV